MRKNNNTTTLRQVVESINRFVVGDYQRTYQWGHNQISDLTADLFDTLGGQSDHFFGTLILQEGHGAVDVVDGQQRLTTIFVFVATLRDEIDRLGIKEITSDDPGEMPINVWERTRGFLYFSNRVGDIRLSPNRFIADLYDRAVMAVDGLKIDLPEKDRRSTLAFRKAVVQIRDAVRLDLAGLEGVDRLARINVLLDTLLEHFLVLVVSTGSMEESLEIFLTLNDRGQALGPSDLVRGEVLRARGHGLAQKDVRKLHDEVNSEWENVTETVREPENFLRHFLVATTGKKVQKKRVVSTVKELISDENPTKKKHEAASLWQKLIADAEIYGEIIQPSGHGKESHFLQLLQPLSKSQRILLLPIIRQISDPTMRVELVRLVMVLAFRWVVAGGNAQKLEDFFQEQCARTDSEDFGEVLKKNLRGKISTLTVDPFMYFSQEASNAYVVRALLFALEKILRGKANDIDPARIHLEHIAPQKATEHWMEVLGVGDDGDSYNQTVNSPGNLTLLDHKLNMQAQQKPFPDKCDGEYKKSSVYITRDLTQFESWSVKLIEARTRWLSTMFELVWSLEEDSATGVLTFSDWQKREKSVSG